MTRKADLRQSAIDLRRSKVIEELAQGFRVREISDRYRVSESTIKRDISFLQRQSKENIRYFVEDKLIFEFEKALATLDIINRKCWELTTKTETKRETLESLSLIKDVSKDRLEILTHGEMLRQCLKVSEKNNRSLQRLENKYSNSNSTNKAKTQTQTQDTVSSQIKKEESEQNGQAKKE